MSGGQSIKFFAETKLIAEDGFPFPFLYLHLYFYFNLYHTVMMVREVYNTYMDFHQDNKTMERDKRT